MTGLDDNWFTEIYAQESIAFPLRIRRKLHEETTPYQTISIYETETFGNLMAIDGCVMLSGRDNFLYHEMMAHPVLFTHRKPKRVAIIGGGDCGTLQEVLRHPNIEEVWQAEIDERVTRLSETWFRNSAPPTPIRARTSSSGMASSGFRTRILVFRCDHRGQHGSGGPSGRPLHPRFLPGLLHGPGRERPAGAADRVTADG